MAVLTEALPRLVVGREWPDTLWLARRVETGAVACYCLNGVHGVVVWSEKEHGEQWLDAHGLFGLVLEAVGFDEAREVAKGKGLPIVCLQLWLGDGEYETHWVR